MNYQYIYNLKSLIFFILLSFSCTTDNPTIIQLPDRISPSGYIVSPLDGSAVSGTTTLQVIAIDNEEVDTVFFMIKPQNADSYKSIDSTTNETNDTWKGNWDTRNSQWIENEKLRSLKSDLISSAEQINDITFIGYKSDLDADSIKQLAFDLKNSLSNFFIVLTSNNNNKPLISIMIDEQLVESKDWNAGKMVRELAKEIKGGGGGQAFFATAGGSDLSGLDNVISKAKEMVLS